MTNNDFLQEGRRIEREAWVSRIQRRIDELESKEERHKLGITKFEAVAIQDALKELLGKEEGV